MLGAGDRDEVNTQNTSDYDVIMDLEVENNDKNENKTWRTIYKEIYERYFVEVKLFPRSFINNCRKHPNEPQNIPTDIKNNLNTIALEKSLYAQVASIRCKSMVQKKYTGEKLK